MEAVQLAANVSKRSNPCDYQPQSNKRRGNQRQRKQDDDSDSDLVSAEEPSADPSLSPETSSHSASRRGSNVDRNTADSYSSVIVSPSDRRDDHVAPGSGCLAYRCLPLQTTGPYSLKITNYRILQPCRFPGETLLLCVSS